MTSKLTEKDTQEEQIKSFDVFANNKDHIDFEDLKELARELGENMSEDELKEMMFEANKSDREGVVYKNDFLSVLKDEEK